MAKYLGQDGLSKLISLIKSALNTKQDKLEFDDTPTASSDKILTSGAIYDALQNVSIDMDDTPKSGSQNAVTSGGVYDALEKKADLEDGVIPVDQLPDNVVITEDESLPSVGLGFDADTLDGHSSEYFQKKNDKKLVTLSSSAWSDSDLTQSVYAEGVLSDESSQLIIATPKTDSRAEYYSCGIICIGQNTNSLTFLADEIPTNDLNVYFVIQDV